MGGRARGGTGWEGDEECLESGGGGRVREVGKGGGRGAGGAGDFKMCECG